MLQDIQLGEKLAMSHFNPFLFIFQEIISNTSISTKNSATKLAENPQENVVDMSVTEEVPAKSVYQRVQALKGGVVSDIGSDDKISDSSVEEDSKAKEETHSDSETGECKESNKEVTDRRIVSPVENNAESDTNVEVRLWNDWHYVAFVVLLSLPCLDPNCIAWMWNCITPLQQQLACVRK